MKKFKYILLLLVFITGASGLLAQENKKLAQTGCQFLSVGLDARSTSMAEALTSMDGYSTSLFYNPAGMARMENLLDLNLSHMTWIADMKYYSGSVAVNPFGLKYGILGISLVYVDYGEFQGTRVNPNTEAGYDDIGNFKPTALAAGLGYAIQLSDRFSVGAHVKYVRQELGSSLLSDNSTVTNEVDVVAFDFGTLYQTGFKSLAFGMSIRNFSQELKFQNEGFQLPLTLKIGISMDAMDFIMPGQQMHKLLVAVDAVHNRDYPEQVNLGMEYTFDNLVSLRGGYMFNNDEHGITGGIGIQKFGLGFDYGYTPFGVFKDVHRLSVRYTM